MDETEITKALRKEKLSLHVTAFFHGNIVNFYNAKEFSAFLIKQEELWNKTAQKNPFWTDIKQQFTSLRTLWSSLSTHEPFDIVELVRDIEKTTYSRPLFIHNQKAVDYMNEIYNLNKNNASLIIKQLLEPQYTHFNRQQDELKNIYTILISILTSFDASSDEMRQLNEKTKDLIQETHSQVDNLLHKYNQDKKVNEEQYNNFVTQYEDNLKKITEENINRFIQIQQTYEEKIRISTPADLWNKKMYQYKKRGYIWALLSFLNAGIVTTICFLFFKYFPDVFINSNEHTINISSTIKWLILTGIGLGTFIYLLRLCTKLSLSSFHMSRDAEEKCALTSFYLSLIHDKKFDPEKEYDLKTIVMNSLFARVDTGLLKGDTSPTLPSSGLNEFIKLIHGK